MTFFAHFNFDFLLVFVDHAYREAETNDDKVHVRAIRCKRRYPSTLASALIADPPCTPPGKALGFAHRRHSIVGKQVEILTVTAVRPSRSTLVKHKCADLRGRQHPLQRIELSRRVVLGTVQ